MIAVIFELRPTAGREAEYFGLAAPLKPALEVFDGFISVERFESITESGKYLSLSFWRDEAAVVAWRAYEDHRGAQARARNGVLQDYRLRVAAVTRDYGMTERSQAPADSLAHHQG